MKEIPIPSDEALQARGAEITANKREQEKAAWQAKVSELEANIIIIEQQIAALHEQADQGNYDTDITSRDIKDLRFWGPNFPEEVKRAREDNRQRKIERIKKIRLGLGAIGLRDNEPVVYRYREEDLHFNGILCTQGDTIMYAEQWLGFLGEFESDTPDYESVMGAKTNVQYLLCPSIAPEAPDFARVVAFSRRGAYMADANVSNYALESGDYSLIDEIERAAHRYRVNCLIEGVEALLTESGEYCKLKYGDPYPSGRSSWREQTYTLSSEATAVVSARYETYLQQDPAYKEPELEFPEPYDGEDINDYYERAGIDDYNTRALEALRASYNIPHKHLEEVVVRHIDTAGAERYISLNKNRLMIDKSHGPGGGLSFEEAENLIAQITAEKV